MNLECKDGMSQRALWQQKHDRRPHTLFRITDPKPVMGWSMKKHDSETVQENKKPQVVSWPRPRLKAWLYTLTLRQASNLLTEKSEPSEVEKWSRLRHEMFR